MRIYDFNTARRYLVGAVAAMTMASSQAAGAPIVLDDFSVFQEVLVGISNTVVQSTVDTTSVVGHHRTIQAQKLSPASQARRINVSVDPDFGALVFEQGTDVRGKALLTYNGASTGLPGSLPGAPPVRNIEPLDVWEPNYGLKIVGGSDNLGLPVSFTFYGAGMSASATLQLRANDQGGDFENPYFVSNAGNQRSLFFIPLTSFSHAAEHESIFSAVDAFQVYFDGTGSRAGTDASLAYLGISTVPEPTTYVLIGLGLVAIGLLRRRV